MKKLKKMIISLLCEIGKGGVGKSTVWGAYEMKVPIELLESSKGAGDKTSKYKH